jgi:hypothetical protein
MAKVAIRYSKPQSKKSQDGDIQVIIGPAKEYPIKSEAYIVVITTEFAATIFSFGITIGIEEVSAGEKN